MWAIATYHQVSMFSLKASNATSTGGHSLLVTTPFSIKMALLDAALRIYGAETGAAYFPLLGALSVAISLPPHIVVNNCFVRIHKPRRGQSGETTATSEEGEIETGEGPFIRSVAFREYVQYSEPIHVALKVDTAESERLLTPLLSQITYFGKRGGFVQLLAVPTIAEELDSSFTEITRDSADFALNGTLQMLDDCGSGMTFAHANIYDSDAEGRASKRITLGKERVLRHVVLPYRLSRSSRGYSLYERISAGEGR